MGCAVTCLESGLFGDLSLSDVFSSRSDIVEKNFVSSIFPTSVIDHWVINDAPSCAPRAVPMCTSRLNRSLHYDNGCPCFTAEIWAYVMRKCNIHGSLCRLPDRKPAAIYRRNTEVEQKICCVRSPPSPFYSSPLYPKQQSEGFQGSHPSKYVSVFSADLVQ